MDWYVVSEWRLLPVSRVADVISNCQFYRDERDELHRAADALCWLANLAEAGAPGLDLLRPDWSAHDMVQQLPWDESQVVWRSIAEEAERSRVGDNSRLAESPSRDWFLSMSGIEQLGSNAGIEPEIRDLLLGLVPGAPARAHLREMQGRPEPDKKDLALATFFAEPRKALTPQEQADQHRGWYDETMGADHWFSLADVDPARAAMLLCQFNPHGSWSLAEQVTNDETGPLDLVKLREQFEALGRTEPRSRTLADWLGIANKLKLKHHSWIDTYVAAAGIKATETLGAPTEAVSAQTPSAEPASTGVNLSREAITLHSTKGQRRNLLTPVIEAAQRDCGDPKDTDQVFAMLAAMAEKKVAPLLGATERGIQYLKNGEAGSLSRDALHKRLHPETRGNPAKRR